MARPTLDIFYLTFNAGKDFIDVPEFSNHLSKAFGQDDPLPELVVVSLQEMAPLSSAFIGSYFLSPYWSRYETAVNVAAARFLDDREEDGAKDKAYTLVRCCNVGMTGIMLFARDAGALSDVQSAEVGFGAGDMANKGAVALRMMYRAGGKETELTFVSTHMAAMEWNLERRNRNWESIVSGLVFADPKKIMQADSQVRAQSGSRDDADAQPLLFHPGTDKALHNVSIYKPTSHLFVAGDLNYRLSKTSPPLGAAFPETDPGSENHYSKFLARDQLTTEKKAGRTLHGLTEAPINFPPTYKYKRVTPSAEGEAPRYKFASHRWPGWCDRVLYLDVPEWVKGAAIKVKAYNCLPVVRSSDHRAVFLRAQVPVLTPSELEPPEDATELLTTKDDPRLRLPVSVSVDSWEHRAAVKKWEYVIGWSLMFGKSKQGLLVIATVLLVGLGAWLYSGSQAS